MRPLVLPLATAVVAACGGGSAPPPDADEALACINSGRGEMYSVGLEHPGKAGLLDVKLMSANPAPPGFNDNTWVIQVNSMSAGVVGSPMDGATILVTPFMPDHQHGPGAYTPQVMELTTPGQYQISDINTWMPGYWEIALDAVVPGTSPVEDSAVFKFCIPA